MRRKWVLIAGGAMAAVVLAIGAAIAVQLYRSDDPALLTEAPAIPSAARTASATGSATPAAGQPATGGAVHYGVGTGSSAKYVVREKLANLPTSTNAVGETTAVTGDLYLRDGQLAATPPSVFTVDLRQLKSDESRRDASIRSTTLRTSQFPNATFILETTSGGFPANYAEGAEVSFTSSGKLTIRDQTRNVTWQVKARRSGDTVTILADTSFNMSDFGVEPPDVRGIAKAEDGVQLQVAIVATRQA